MTMSDARFSVGPIVCSFACVLAACGGKTPDAASPASGGQPAGAAAAPAKECPATFTIDDMEDHQKNQVIVQNGRNGYWYTFLDKQGSTVSPPAGKTFIMSPGGVNNSTTAAHMLGKTSSSGDPIFVGMGFSFTNPKAQYDASAYSGVSFYAKVGPGSAKGFRLKVPDVNTDPDGKVCTECYNDFGTDLTLTEEWKQYVVPFSKMTQLDGWGSPSKPAIDKSKVYGMQWQINQPGTSFDLWVDDVAFTGCP